MSFKNTVLEVFESRPTRGFTVGEAYDRLDATLPEAERTFAYATVRARIYDLVREGRLENTNRTRANGTPGQVFVLAPGAFF